jgi:hypothetical protein
MRSVWMGTILATAWAATAYGQTAPDEPVCTAEQVGSVLVTTIEYTNGYRVQAPWRVTAERKYSRGGVRLTAVLDRIIEFDAFTRARDVTSLPDAVQVTFRGTNQRQVLLDAARIWCVTVAKAIAARPAQSPRRVADAKT